MCPRTGPATGTRGAARASPRTRKFATKPQLAAEIVKDLLAEGRCLPWVTGDEVYGRIDARPSSDAKSPGAAFLAEHGRDDGHGLRGFRWLSLLEGQPLALPQNQTPPRWHAPSGPMHPLW
jgi:hypothetical protein